MPSYKYVSLNLYCMVTGMYTLLLFIRAFLPMTEKVESFATDKDIPTHVGDEQINVTDLYQNHVDRVIIMVIDAFRVDFANDLNGADNMPYIHSLLMAREAFAIVGNVQTPTVTMPRIKALTTGTVPNFIDIVYNLGSNSITEDNIIKQAEDFGSIVIFYGDETWLKLFPTSFKRKEGTSSFFVADFTEVDDNVTRNLDEEFSARDWKIMILHYLGLDHIGHLEGPKSAHVKPKLLEMDQIVQKIHHNMIEWDKHSSLKSILIVCGDHGMKDSGGHGGATTAETTVPIITIGVRQEWNVSSDEKPVSQIDLVPTLSILLGLPIPKGNIGKLIPQVFQNVHVKNKLFAYYYNAKQVADNFRNIHSYQSKEAYLEYEEAVRLHTLWLKANSQMTHQAGRIEELYMSSLDRMSEALGNSRRTHDVFCLFVSICIELQICAILFCEKMYARSPAYHILQIAIFIFVFSFLNIFYCLIAESESVLCTFRIDYLLGIVIPMVVIFSVNIAIIVNFGSSSLFLQTPSNHALKCFIAGSVLHLVSLSSSSFIEEEHQVWYFGWLTFLVVVFCNQCQRTYNSGCLRNSIIFLSLYIAICHRFLRTLNQTGDKWASLPDISDWLLEPHNKGFLSFIFVLGLLGNCTFLCYWQWIYREQSVAFRVVDIVFSFCCLVIIYFYRAATGAITKLFDTVDSKGIAEARLFWYLLLLMTLKQIIVSVSRRAMNNINTIGEISNFCIVLWMLLINLLHRPYNVLLPPAQACASIFLGILYQQTSKTKDDTRWLTIAHYWLGMVFYFYQGNSNSLATIDVASGYVGLQDYNPILVGIFLLVNTFSAPVFSLLLLVYLLFLEGRKRGIHWLLDHTEVAFHTLICYRLCTITLYMVLMAFQRYHLFVWSVFSPKLLYESVYTLVLFVVIFLTYMVFYTVNKLLPFVTTKTNKSL